MSVSLVGIDRLAAVLDEAPRIIASNRTTLEDGLLINALAIATHSSGGSMRYRTYVGDAIGPDTSVEIADDRPTEEKVVAFEAFMRITRDHAGVLDTYLKLELEGTATFLGNIEFGVCRINDDQVEGAVAIDEAPAFAVFARGDQ